MALLLPMARLQRLMVFASVSAVASIKDHNPPGQRVTPQMNPQVCGETFLGVPFLGVKPRERSKSSTPPALAIAVATGVSTLPCVFTFSSLLPPSLSFYRSALGGMQQWHPLLLFRTHSYSACKGSSGARCQGRDNNERPTSYNFFFSYMFSTSRRNRCQECAAWKSWPENAFAIWKKLLDL